MAVASAERNVRVWDADTGKLLQTLTIDKPATCVAFAGRDGHIVAGSNGRESTVVIWKLKGGKYALASSTPLSGALVSLNTSPDGQWVVAVGIQARVYFIDIAQGKLRRTLQELGNPMGDVAFSPNGKTVFSIGQSFRYWDSRLDEMRGNTTASMVISDEQRHRDAQQYLRMKAGSGETVAPLPNGEWVAAVLWFGNREGRSSDFVLFDGKTGRERKVLSNSMKDVTFLAASPDSKTLAVGFDSDKLELWSVTGGKKAEIKCDGVWRIRSGAFLKDGRFLAVTNEGGSRVEIFDVVTGKSVRRLKP